MRYANSNIPVDYWSLSMEHDFKGDSTLFEIYSKLTSDLKKVYSEGTAMCFAGSHGIGKQLALDTELPTPNGFVKLIDLKEGDQLFDENGDICNVIKLHPINLSPESYEIEFDDKSKVEACADHLWLTWTRKARANKKNGVPEIRSTKEILNTLKTNDKQKITNHSIPCTKPLNYTHKDLLINPYVLGCWLGDGISNEGSIESADKEILDYISKFYSINLVKSTAKKTSKSSKYRIGDIIFRNKMPPIGKLKMHLKEFNLLNNKHIPDIYMHSSYEQRLNLLQGLLDTDGFCSKDFGYIEISSSFPKLANDIHQLVLSLGIKSHINENNSFLNGKKHKNRFRIVFTTQLPVFKFKKKLNNIRANKKQLCRSTHRYIVNIKPIPPKSMRCITVDSPSNLFLITRSFIPTHNTMTTACLLKRVVEKGYSGLYTNLTDIVAIMTSANSGERFEARKDLMSVDFLVIDEFDSRYMSTNNAADLFGRTLEDVFRARIQNRLPLFFCTNSPKVLDGFAGPIKKSLSSLMSRVHTVAILGKDFRTTK